MVFATSSFRQVSPKIFSLQRLQYKIPMFIDGAENI